MFSKPSKKQLFIGVAIFIILAGLIFYFLNSFGRDPNKVWSSNIDLGVIVNDGKQNGRAFIKTSYLKSEEQLSFVNAVLDINTSGDYEEGEWIIKNIPVKPQRSVEHNIFFTLGLPLEGQKKLRVILSDFPLTEAVWAETTPKGRQYIEKEVVPESFEVKEFLAQATKTRLPEATSTVQAPGKSDVQINLRDPISDEIIGAHTLKIIQVYNAENKIYAEILDSAGPDGLDVYEILNDKILHYGPYDGLAIMDLGEIR